MAGRLEDVQAVGGAHRRQAPGERLRSAGRAPLRLAGYGSGPAGAGPGARGRLPSSASSAGARGAGSPGPPGPRQGRRGARRCRPPDAGGRRRGRSGRPAGPPPAPPAGRPGGAAGAARAARCSCPPGGPSAPRLPRGGPPRGPAAASGPGSSTSRSGSKLYAGPVASTAYPASARGRLAHSHSAAGPG